MGKTTTKKSDEKKLGNAIEEALMEAYMSGDLNDYSHDDVEFAGVQVKPIEPIKTVEKKSLKIPGVRKEDGSACCGGGCCEVGDKKKTTTVFSKKQYLEIINQVLDPETGVGITDMGLIYDVEEKADGLVKVTMTLTSMGCPAGGQITTEIDGMLRIQPHVKDVAIEVVWEPAWNPDMMNPDVKAMLFGN